jgi:hypothetical protein
VLGLPAPSTGRSDDRVTVGLPDAGQRLEFVPARAGQGEGITAVTVAGLPGGEPQVIGGVRFASEETT